MAKPRTLAQPGQSLVEASQGRLITYAEDVLDIKGRIEREFRGAIGCIFDTDPSAECWVITQFDRDGTESLLFTTKFLTESTVERIRRADQASGRGQDFLIDFEKDEQRLEREKDHKLSEKLGDAAEHFAYALRKDGLSHRPTVFLANSHKRRRGIS